MKAILRDFYSSIHDKTSKPARLPFADQNATHIRLSIRLVLIVWDLGLYSGLHQFYRSKGFDPESQDLARHLDLPAPLYRLPLEGKALFSHDEENVEEIDGKGESPIDSQLASVDHGRKRTRESNIEDQFGE
ncbi:hypothetical protein K438DRAFT_1760946 [Mycena galopus ATCC 62051]|nr:hypothetical protein K438DRAFT_1760946 [Mycena galopus ATCC 62051]